MTSEIVVRSIEDYWLKKDSWSKTEGLILCLGQNPDVYSKIFTQYFTGIGLCLQFHNQFGCKNANLAGHIRNSRLMSKLPNGHKIVEFIHKEQHKSGPYFCFDTKLYSDTYAEVSDLKEFVGEYVSSMEDSSVGLKGMLGIKSMYIAIINDNVKYVTGFTKEWLYQLKNYEVLMNESLREKTIEIISVGPVGKIKVEAFLEWARRKHMPINAKVLSYYGSLDKSKTIDDGETLSSDIKWKRGEKDKVACQAIARSLWRNSPDMTISAMIKTKEIQKDGNGTHYKAKTLRKWVQEVDSRPPEKKHKPKKESTRIGE